MKQKNQDLLNLIYPAIFIVVLLLLCGWIIVVENGSLPTTISTFDLILLILASFRLVRAVTYDKMLKFVRDWCHYKTDGTERTYGVIRTLYDLMSCPWCTGIYTSILVVFLYFISPVWWFVILIFALSGMATFLQLVINLVGTKYELADLELDEKLQHFSK